MRILFIIGSIISSSAASGPLSEGILRIFIHLLCPLGPENAPTRIFPALSNASDSLYDWAALDVDEFVLRAKDIIKAEHARAINDKKISAGIMRNINLLRGDGLNEEQIIEESARRYHGIMQALEEFN